MLNTKPVKILIIDDDEDDYFIIADFIKDIGGTEFICDWCANVKIAVEQFRSDNYDVFFVDYRLGEKNGLELLKEAMAVKCDKPIILLTGKGNKAIDIEAMKNGATDYLIKSELSTEKLERCIRYALERSLYLRTIKESEFKYRNLFESSKDALFIAGENLLFKEVNVKASQFFKRNSSKLQTLQLYDFINNDEQKNKIKAALALNENIDDLEIEIKNTDNELKVCLLSLLHENKAAGYNLIHGIIHDITNIKKAEKINLQTEKLAANQRLVRVLAHEIRNPLNNISLSADQLSTITETDEDQKVFLGIIQRNSVRINQLITELLDSTKKLEVVFEKQSLQEIVQAALSNAMDRINLQKIKLDIIQPETPLQILADRSKLTIGFSNILINAIEAMHAGKGELRVAITEHQDIYAVSIEDNGKGIAAAQLSNLFEPFYTTKKNGYGLGLAAAYGIFKSHHSTVTVDSIENSGTTFRIEFNKIR